MTDLGAAAKKSFEGAKESGLTEEEAWDSVVSAVVAGSGPGGSGVKPADAGDPPSGGDVGN